jgi:serine/threonine-protein kinase HipA
MNRCPITYEDCGEARYSQRGLRLLSRKLTRLEDLPYTAAQQRREAIRRAGRMSIQGVQPKLSAVLNVEQSAFEIVESGGRYIIKPQMFECRKFPKMRPDDETGGGGWKFFHGLIHSKDAFPVIRRFLTEPDCGRSLSRTSPSSWNGIDTKYGSSMEQVASVLDRFCVPGHREQLFRLTLQLSHRERGCT